MISREKLTDSLDRVKLNYKHLLVHAFENAKYETRSRGERDQL